LIRHDLRILIAGGGIGGITTALALRQRGIDAVLFEQPEAFREVGAGIQLSANATRVLCKLGLGAALARVAVYPEGRDYRAWDTGERVFWTRSANRRRSISARRTTKLTAPTCSTFWSMPSATLAST
jgi:salicylate hydroxylase